VLSARRFGGAGAGKSRLPFDSGLEQATKGLRNIANHLEVDPKAKIIAVTHADASIS